MIDALVLTQFPMHKGLRVFVVIEELQQLDKWNVIQSCEANKLSREEKDNAWEYSIFLKQKRSGKIKGRGCENGRKQ